MEIFTQWLTFEHFGKVTGTRLTMWTNGEVFGADIIRKFGEVLCPKDTISLDDASKGDVVALFLHRDWAVLLTIDLKDDSGRVMGFEAVINTIDASVIDLVARTANNLGFNFPSGGGDADSVHVEFAFPPSPGQEGTVHKSFQQVPLDSIAHNYTSDVVEKARVLIEELKTSRHGLVIVNGPVGTGKTWLIRSILSEAKSRTGVICTPPLWFLEQTGALNDAFSSYERPLVILEDLGDMATKDAVTFHINQMSNLLNLTDGLLSMLSEAVFVLTFNYGVGEISEALTRPGRCLAHIEIGELSMVQAEERTGIRPLKQSSYSLAEVYEILATKKDILQKRVGIGLAR